MTTVTNPAHIPSDHDQLAMKIGIALNRWTSLEDNLMRLFGVLIDKPMAYGSEMFVRLHNFNARLDMVDCVAGLALKGKPELRYWKSVRPHLKELSEDRNILAHCFIGTRPDGTLVAGQSVAHHIAGSTKRSLSAQEIDELMEDFEDCFWKHLYQFEIHLTGYYVQDAVYHAPIKLRRPPRAQRRKA
jgi:hypothetical protein